jgi:hypothetical protein
VHLQLKHVGDLHAKKRSKSGKGNVEENRAFRDKKEDMKEEDEDAAL